MRRTWSVAVLAGEFWGVGEMGERYFFAALAGGVDARGYARDILRELLRALGVDVHVFGHG